jgi:uncharacterized protein (TIGR03435 family)
MLIAKGRMVLVALTLGLVQAADLPLAFEAASVKPTSPNLPNGRIVVGGLEPVGGPGSNAPGRIRYRIISLKLLLINAYGVQDFQIAGPGWMDTAFFQIEATMPPTTTKAQFREMLQNLLSDRFKLKIHRAAREVPSYDLVVSKDGPKLKKSPANAGSAQDDGASPPPPPLSPSPVGKDGFPTAPNIPAGRAGMFGTTGLRGIRLTARHQTMASLAEALTDYSGRPVLDTTGLTGEYDFTLTFSKKPTMEDSPDAESPPSIFTALRAQLGLHLVTRKGSFETIIIDHLEKIPTEN